jgi:hypothetical protein
MASVIMWEVTVDDDLKDALGKLGISTTVYTAYAESAHLYPSPKYPV